MPTKLTVRRDIKAEIIPTGINFFKNLWGENWAYVNTVVNVTEEPILILNKNFRVMTANKAFYQEFQVTAKDTEGNIFFKLGNGQWDMPALHRLMKNILPQNSFFKGFGVNHNFPIIGQRFKILNGRQIYFDNNSKLKLKSPIILLVMEDVTKMMALAGKISSITTELAIELLARTEKLEVCLQGLEKEMIEIKKETLKKRLK